MPDLFRQLLQTTSCAREFLDTKARREVAAFIRSRLNPDGGFRGRDEKSDLYYTFFAVASLRALGCSVPFSNLWKFLKSFGTGDQLDAVHFPCFVQLRSVFPMLGKTRRKLFQTLETLPVETPYDAFLKMGHASREKFPVGGPTPQAAAAAVLNRTTDSAAIELLMARHCKSGGFCANPDVPVPDLLSTAVALFALRMLGADFSDIREPCLSFIESLWRESGGFSGHPADEFEDVEYTFYGLLSIGSLVAPEQQCRNSNAGT